MCCWVKIRGRGNKRAGRWAGGHTEPRVVVHVQI